MQSRAKEDAMTEYCGLTLATVAAESVGCGGMSKTVLRKRCLPQVLASKTSRA